MKRQREQNRKDKARAKEERLAARRASPTGEKGPPIAWDEPGGADGVDGVDPASNISPPTTPDDASGDGSS